MITPGQNDAPRPAAGQAGDGEHLFLSSRWKDKMPA
jgi:hypothetical protein